MELSDAQIRAHGADSLRPDNGRSLESGYQHDAQHGHRDRRGSEHSRHRFPEEFHSELLGRIGNGVHRGTAEKVSRYGPESDGPQGYRA